MIAAYLAETLMEQGDLDEAEAVLDKATKQEPLPQAVTGRGWSVAAPAC